MESEKVAGKIIYLAGPYSGSGEIGSNQYIEERDANVTHARNIALKLWKAGASVLCPHLNSYDMDDQLPYEAFLVGYLQMLKLVDLVVLLPGWQESRGARLEREYAVRNGIAVCEWSEL